MADLISGKPGSYRRHYSAPYRSTPAKVLLNTREPATSEAATFRLNFPQLQPCYPWLDPPCLALCAVGMICSPLNYGLLIETVARPRLALRPRAQPVAAISTSSVKSATALERQSPTGQSLTASGKVRKEVPLPSQEKKEGAMQYVLFVPLPPLTPGTLLTSLQDHP